MMTEQGTGCRLPDDAAEALSVLTGALYDAALDRTQWTSAMGLASCFMESFASVVYEWSRVGEARGFIYDDAELAPEYKALYHDRYVRIDPVTSEHHYVALDEPFSITDVVDPERYRQSAFYREWLEPQHIVDLLAAPVRRDTFAATIFGVVRHERDGEVDDLMRRRMRLLVPHMRRALALTDIIGTAAPRAAELKEVLDGLSTGVFLADADGRLLHANAAGEQLLAEGDAMRSRNGRLSPADHSAAASLTEALRAAGAGVSLPGDHGHAIPLATRNGNYVAAHLMPLARRGEAGAAAAIFVHRAAATSAIAPDLVGRTFGLTPAEGRVLSHIVEAGSVAEAAERLRISQATVKTHLSRIFDKTGTARQADLVKLLAGFSAPLR